MFCEPLRKEGGVPLLVAFLSIASHLEYLQLMAGGGMLGVEDHQLPRLEAPDLEDMAQSNKGVVGTLNGRVAGLLPLPRTSVLFWGLLQAAA